MFKDFFNIKKKKKKESEAEDEGNFTYDEDLKTNEFNDATIEYGDGEEAVVEEEFEDEEELDKNKILFWALIGFLILLIIIMLIVRGCVLTPGKVSSVELTTPNIIYVGERSEVSVKAKGSGNLKQTVYKFESSNNAIVEIKAKGFVQGKTATNELIPLTTGRFLLSVSGKLNDVTLAPVEKEIVICRKLNEDSFNGELIAVLSKSTKLVLDLGEDGECYENLTYKIEDESIVTIDAAGNLIGQKEGTTTITFTNNGEDFTKEIKVVNDSTKVTGLSVDKSSVSLQVGKTIDIKPTITPNDATNQNITWISSNSSVASVSKIGKITGVGAGTAVVTATTEDGNYKALITVKVTKKTSGTGGSGSTKPSTDTTSPTLTSVKMYSNNTNSIFAKEKNAIIIEVTANEKITTKPAIYINGKSATVTCSTTTTCIGSVVVDNTMFDGLANFVVTGYKDATGNVGNEVRTTTDKSYVIIDKTVPSCYAMPTSTTETSAVVNFSATDTYLKQIKDPSTNSLLNYNCTGSYQKSYTFPRTTTGSIYTLTVSDCAGNVNTCTYNSKTSTTYTASLSKVTGVSTINGATMLSCSVTSGSTCTVKLPTFTAGSSYTAMGWSTSNSVPTTFNTTTPGNYAMGGTVTLSKNITLYALAKRNVGSSGSSSTSSRDDAYTITPVEPTTTYQCISWGTKESCSIAQSSSVADKEDEYGRPLTCKTVSYCKQYGYK